MQVAEVVHPEEETADRWAKKLNINGVVDSFDLPGEYSIIEAKVPPHLDGLTLEEAALNRKYNVLVLTTIKVSVNVNDVDKFRTSSPKVQGVASSKTRLSFGDIMVIYGKTLDIQNLLRP